MLPGVHVGLIPPYRAGVAADPEWMTRFAELAERLGFESLYLPEHVVVPTGYDSTYPYSPSGRMPLGADCPIPDPLDLAAFLLARTDTLVLATGIVIAPHQHPLVLAKRCSTLDVLSGGRFRLGVGVGWMREELESTGIDWDERGAVLDEHLDAMRVVWRDAPASFEGRWYRFADVHSVPRPIRAGGVPLHVGGHSKAAARRAGRAGDGFQPLGLDDDLLDERVGLMRRTAEEHERDPDALELTVGAPLQQADADLAGRRAEQGVTRLLLSSATAAFGELEDEMAAAADRLGLVP
jgi:probable F420-dependent oxidoreductase